MGLEIPDIGIFDTRLWDANYSKYINGKGPNPGAHPDPQCKWNIEEDTYNHKEYKEMQLEKRR